MCNVFLAFEPLDGKRLVQITNRFSLPKAEHVKIEVLNVLGRKVITLLDEPKRAGRHRIRFDTKDKDLASGVYVLRIEAGTFLAAKKMLYLK